jgi:polar amino acid transport system substrate-binding protein
MRHVLKAAALLLTGLLPAATQAADESLSRIVAAGTLRIGVELTAPWTMKDASGELTGFEADMARRLASDMGVSPSFVPLAFGDLLPKLLAGEVDIVAAGMTITPERALQVAFSDPTNVSGVTAVWRKAERETGATEGPVRIAVLARSSDAEAAAHAWPEAEMKPYPTMQEALAALLAGETDGMVASIPRPELAAHLYDSELVLGEDGPLVTQADAFALRPDDMRLQRFVDNWIAAREADGYLAALRDYYFAGFDWLEAMPEEAGP